MFFGLKSVFFGVKNVFFGVKNAPLWIEPILKEVQHKSKIPGNFMTRKQCQPTRAG